MDINELKKEEEEKLAPKKSKWDDNPLVILFVGFSSFLVPLFLVGALIAVIFAVFGLEDQITDVAQYFQDHPGWEMVSSIMTSTLAIAIIYLAVRKRGGWKALGLSDVKWNSAWMLPGLYVIYFIGIALIFMLLESYFPEVNVNQEQNVGFDSQLSGIEYFYAFFTLVILAPITEEIIFRGYVFQGLKKSFGWVISAFITSSLFALAHGQLNVAIDVFFLAMIMSLIMHYSKNLWLTIIFHAFKNLIAFIFIYIIPLLNYSSGF